MIKDTKGVIWSRKSNGQTIQWPNRRQNDKQWSTKQYTENKEVTTRILLKSRDEPRCAWKVHVRNVWRYQRDNRTDNVQKKKGQTTIYKILHRKTRDQAVPAAIMAPFVLLLLRSSDKLWKRAGGWRNWLRKTIYA